MFACQDRRRALFYGQPRRRTVVPFDTVLRDFTPSAAVDTRAPLASGRTPRIGYDKKRCDVCSLIEICRPRVTGAALGRGLAS
jgi:CRISPR-associated exonuclease Cas4